MIKGVLSEDDIASKLKELKIRRADIELSLKSALSDNSAFELHEPKMSSYLQAIAGLAACSPNGGTREVHSEIRELIEKVVVEARPKQEPAIEVHGSLDALVRPFDALASGGKVVAEVRYSRFPPNENPLFSIHLTDIPTQFA